MAFSLEWARLRAEPRRVIGESGVKPQAELFFLVRYFVILLIEFELWRVCKDLSHDAWSWGEGVARLQAEPWYKVWGGARKRGKVGE